MGARSAFVAAARQHALDTNWRGCARALLRWRTAVARGEAARARPCDGRAVGAALARGASPGAPDAAATARLASFVGDGRAALLDRVHADAAASALVQRCEAAADALERGDDEGQGRGEELAKRAGDQVATKQLARARARLLLALGDAEAAVACSASRELLRFADPTSLRILVEGLLAQPTSKRRGEDRVTACLRACRKCARTHRGRDARSADLAMEVADAAVQEARLTHLGAGALLETLFAADRRRDAALVLSRMRARDAGWPQPTAEVFSIVLRDLVLREAPSATVEDVLMHMANDGIAPTDRILDACLAAPHPVQISLCQRLHALSGARPAYTLFVERCVQRNLAAGDGDEARRAAAVLDQMWPGEDVAQVFAEFGAELY